MASPFPGMDPYLEGEFWQEFHERLANQISTQLMPRLSPKYAALLAKRAVPNAIEVPQLSVEIRDVAQRRLVTVIEILSPANKHGEGAYEYNQRRADLLQTWTSLLELDLLRAGERILLGGPVPPASYYVYVTRASARYTAQVWALQLAEHLPTVPVPLLSPDPDVPLDLQAALDACFALVGYERLLDYSAPLPPPELTPAERDWIATTVRAVGGRP